jgi:hypothetical protein
MGWVDDIGAKRLGATNNLIEIVDLEPERDAVAVRPQRRIADPAVVVFDVEVVQLQHERSVAEQTLVLLPAVAALATEQLLVPATAAWDIGDADQGLGTDGRRV